MSKEKKRRGMKITNPDGSDGSYYGDGPSIPEMIGKALSGLINSFLGSKK